MITAGKCHFVNIGTIGRAVPDTRLLESTNAALRIMVNPIESATFIICSVGMDEWVRFVVTPRRM